MMTAVGPNEPPINNRHPIPCDTVPPRVPTAAATHTLPATVARRVLASQQLSRNGNRQVLSSRESVVSDHRAVPSGQRSKRKRRRRDLR